MPSRMAERRDRMTVDILIVPRRDALFPQGKPK
jgi:hypothetical protein